MRGKMARAEFKHAKKAAVNIQSVIKAILAAKKFRKYKRGVRPCLSSLHFVLLFDAPPTTPPPPMLMFAIIRISGIAAL